MNAPAVRIVRTRKSAKHVPARDHGAEARVLDARRLSGASWLRVRFEDGCELWTLPKRVDEADR